MSRFRRALRVPDMSLSIDSPVLLCLATIALFGVSALVPVMATEPLLLGLAAAVPPALVIPITLLATATHMAAKAMVYLGSRNLEKVVSPQKRLLIERMCTRLDRRRAVQNGTVFISAITGLPPFYAVAMAGGVLRIPFSSFLILGFLGRAIRFGALVFAPQLLLLPG